MSISVLCPAFRNIDGGDLLFQVINLKFCLAVITPIFEVFENIFAAAVWADIFPIHASGLDNIIFARKPPALIRPYNPALAQKGFSVSHRITDFTYEVFSVRL